MEWLLICFVAFSASLLTFFSGFGLGTLLMPVVAIFFPLPVAVAITAIVHLLNKLFKLLLLWKYVDRKVVLSFGIPALLAAIPGALLLDILARAPVLAHYTLMGQEHAIHPVKLVAGLLLFFFATAEWIPFLQRAAFRRLGLPAGGILSGFFGGLTGHQGAFRSAFLVQQKFSETGFIATNAAIAALVDSARLLIYGLTFDHNLLQGQEPLIVLAVLSSFAGVTLGGKLLTKITLTTIQRLVVTMMYGLGAALIAGWI